MKNLLAAVLLSVTLLPGAFAATDDGVQYQTLDNPQPTAAGPGQVEVAEFFWYACPHCYAFEPYLENWLAHKPKNVEFQRIPVMRGYAWAKPMAHAYYTEVALGVVDKLHKAIFDEIHVKHHILKTKDDFKQFFEKHGVSSKDFDSAWNSFSVAVNMKRAAKEESAYQIMGVPTIAVGGRYTATLGAGQGPSDLPKAIDFLLHKVEKDKQ